MLGWWIIVSTQTPQEKERSDQDAMRAAILAQWESGIGGRSWIEQLLKEGKATPLSKNGGYPDCYAAKVADVLPLIENGSIRPSENDNWTVFGIDEGEEYVQPPGWMGNIQIHADRCAACPPDKLLTITVWDMS